MVTPMALIYKVLFPSIATFETPPSLLSRDPWYALSEEAYVGRAHCTRGGVLSRRLGHPGDGAGVRGRPQDRAPMVGGGRGTPAGVFTPFSPRYSRQPGPAR